MGWDPALARGARLAARDRRRRSAPVVTRLFLLALAALSCLLAPPLVLAGTHSPVRVAAVLGVLALGPGLASLPWTPRRAPHQLPPVGGKRPPPPPPAAPTMPWLPPWAPPAAPRPTSSRSWSERASPSAPSARRSCSGSTRGPPRRPRAWCPGSASWSSPAACPGGGW